MHAQAQMHGRAENQKRTVRLSAFFIPRNELGHRRRFAVLFVSSANSRGQDSAKPAVSRSESAARERAAPASGGVVCGECISVSGTDGPPPTAATS